MIKYTSPDDRHQEQLMSELEPLRQRLRADAARQREAYEKWAQGVVGAFPRVTVHGGYRPLDEQNRLWEDNA